MISDDDSKGTTVTPLNTTSTGKPTQFSSAQADLPPGALAVSQSRSASFYAEMTRPEIDGPRAWLVAIGAFLAMFGTMGLTYAMGVFVPAWIEDPSLGSNPLTAYTLPGTLQLAFFYVAGMVAVPLSDKHGPRLIMSIGISIWFAGVMIGSVCKAPWQLDLTVGLMCGLGAGTVAMTAVTTPAQWFSKYRSTAVSLATAGSGVGNIAFGYGGNSLVIQYGWRASMQIMGGIGLGSVIIAIILIDRRLARFKRGFNKSEFLDLIRHDSNYHRFLLGCFLFQFCFFIPFIILPVYSVDLGNSQDFTGTIVALLGAGSTVGRLVLGPLGDWIGRFTVFRICLLSASAFYVAWPSFTTPAEILIFAFFYPWFAGGFIASLPVIATNLFGVKRMGPAMGFCSVVMIPGAIASANIVSAAYDNTGSYNAAIYAMAGVSFLTAFVFCTLGERSEDPSAMHDQEHNNEATTT